MWLLQSIADPDVMRELRGTDVARSPQQLLKSFALPKTAEQLESEMKTFI